MDAPIRSAVVVIFSNVYAQYFDDRIYSDKFYRIADAMLQSMYNRTKTTLTVFSWW